MGKIQTFKVMFVPKHLNYTFIEICKQNKYLRVKEMTYILDWTNNNFVRRALLIENRIITREDITSELSYLDKNCSLKIYHEIMDMRGYDESQLFSILTFTNTPLT